MMDDEDDSLPSPWAGLSHTDLIDTRSGLLCGQPLYERAGVSEVALSADTVIEALAAVPGGSTFGRHEALRGLLLEHDDSPEALVTETIADAARKLATLSWAIDEVISEWELSRWALTERVSKRERELAELRERLAGLPETEKEAPALRTASALAQEELAGLIAFLDGFRLSERQEAVRPDTDDAPAFARPENVLRLLQAQARQERKKAA
jgi:hypothetical protein